MDSSPSAPPMSMLKGDTIGRDQMGNINQNAEDIVQCSTTPSINGSKIYGITHRLHKGGVALRHGTKSLAVKQRVVLLVWERPRIWHRRIEPSISIGLEIRKVARWNEG